MKIVYLGGYFSPEHSMYKAFQNDGINIIFYICNNNRYYNNKYKKHHLNFNNTGHVRFIPEQHLLRNLKNDNPDFVIHRYYMKKTVMFDDSKKICDKLNIPWIKYIPETNYDDNVKDHINSGQKLLLYAHNTEQYIQNLIPGAVFYPYGASPDEKLLDMDKDRDVGCIARHLWNKSEQRKNSLNFFLEALQGIPLHAYGENWDKVPGVIPHPKYNLEQATQIINRHKIILNIESISTLEGAYSYKMFQAMACGAVVITAYKKSLEQLFGTSGQNLIMVRTLNETRQWIKKLLHNENLRNQISNNCYEYMHQNFNWAKKFREIIHQNKHLLT